MRSTELLARLLVVLFLPLFCGGRSEGKQWFDASSGRAYDAKQTAYRAWCRARNADTRGLFVLAPAEA